MTNALLIEQNDAITTLTLNRPELHNAFDDTLIHELTAALKQIDRDPAIRVVILTANGKSFCAGADLNWMQKMVAYSHEENRRDAKALADLMHLLHHLSKPTLAVVQGAAYGGGVGLIACCDIAIASSNATFCFSEVKIGLIPAVISPYVIKAMGETTARYYFLTAEKFSAEEALRINLLHKVVSPAELTNESQRIAQMLLQNSPAALRAIKKLIDKISQRPLGSSLIHETVEAIADIRVSPEGQERLKAFLEKRSAA